MKFLSQALACLLFAGFVSFSGCASKPDVHKEAYAELKNTRTFENDMTATWKAIEETFRNFKVTRRDPSDVSPNELKQLRKRTLETDWINTQSRDKYIEYQVNGFPQKRFLWTRVMYKVTAETVLGGIQVTVDTSEEIERLNNDGSSAGWEKVNEIDTSRPSEILDKIGNAILSAPPSNQVP